jgi:cell wall-associated NlpC family hydrolase
VTRLDPRIHAYRPDLADRTLVGRVAAERFVEGRELAVAVPAAPMRRAPDAVLALETEALYGERVVVFEETADGWAWGQLVEDRYVGWLPRAALAEPAGPSTHVVAVPRAHLYAAPDIKAPALAGLPLGARVRVAGEATDANARFVLIDSGSGGAIVAQHLAPLGRHATDAAAVAESFLGVPYLWGGKTSLGIDCSGLVQVALLAAGVAAPRDSDMQEAAIGGALPLHQGLPPLRRGDLVFWRGHVGMMVDGERIIHAGAHRMQVAVEPLAEVMARHAGRGLPVTAVRRPGLAER